MVHYGIFTTMGDLIQSSDDGMRSRVSEDLAKNLSSSSTALYVSYHAGKTLLGTTLDVQKQQTRQHTIVYLQETDWVGGRPGLLRLKDVWEFFSNAQTTLTNLGYELLVSDRFTTYLSSVQSGTGILSSSRFSALADYTAGNLLYHKRVTCSTNSPENAFSIISAIVVSYQYYLKFGCSFAITKFAVRDCDVSVLTDGESAHATLNLDSPVSGLDFEHSYYIKTWQQFSKPEMKRSISSQPSRASLSSQVVEKMFSSLYVESGSLEIVPYHDFLVSENIHVSSAVLDRFGLSPDINEGKKKFHLRKTKKKYEPVVSEPIVQELPRRKRPVRAFSDVPVSKCDDSPCHVEGTILGNVSESKSSEKLDERKKRSASSKKSEKPRKQKKQKPPKKPKVKKQKKQKRHGRKGKRKLKVILLILILLLIFVAAVAVLLVLIHQGYLPRVESFLSGVIDTIGNRTA